LLKDIGAEVESTYFDVVNSKPSYEAASASVEEAKANLDAMTEKLRLGMAIPLEVVDAQANYSTAQILEAQALYEYHMALGWLAKAVGSSIVPGAE
jgi:outer membrane protein TolC